MFMIVVVSVFFRSLDCLVVCLDAVKTHHFFIHLVDIDVEILPAVLDGTGLNRALCMFSRWHRMKETIKSKEYT